MRVRLRDFLETEEGLLFAVADYPAADAKAFPALLRYVPDPGGDRGRNGERYRKVPPPEAWRYLRSRHPEYLGPPGDLHRVPGARVRRVWRTDAALRRCDRSVRRLARALAPPGRLGVTGSHLCGLAAPGSDVDLVAYGDGFERARRLLARGLRNRRFRPLSDRDWDLLYEKRRPPLPREEFVLHEERKGNRGMFRGRRFDLLYVRGWPDIRGYRPWRGRPVGTRTLRARLLSVERPFDVPTLYRVDHPDIPRVMSFRHDFVDQVRPGELLEARGRVERRGRELRLVVGKPAGSRREWIRSLTCLEESGHR